MRVFLDTNVLASALATRGLCADLLRLILSDHELLTGEIVIEELCSVLASKFRVPAQAIKAAEALLRSYHVESRPRRLPPLALRQRNDIIVVASALASRADVLVTGDKEILALSPPPAGLAILGPRQFWERVNPKPR
ncbi:MAG: putative toxin-antitoxin system toxin component, PIN family [Candidatus Binataceae bacterium]